MDAATIAEIIKLGSAGAVIIVVCIFLRFITIQGEQWKAFFKLLTESTYSDMSKIATTLDKLIEAVNCINRDLHVHENLEEQRYRQIVENSERRPSKRDL